MKKHSAAASLAMLTVLGSCFAFGQSPVTAAEQKETNSALFTWTAEFDGHTLCTSRDVLLECAGYNQMLSTLKVTEGVVIIGIEYRTEGREYHFAQSLGNQTNAFIVVSAIGDASKKIFLPINEGGHSSVDDVSVSFPAGSVLSATYFAAGPAEPIVPGNLSVHYTVR